jgi:hypothetical protein
MVLTVKFDELAIYLDLRRSDAEPQAYSVGVLVEVLIVADQRSQRGDDAAERIREAASGILGQILRSDDRDLRATVGLPRVESSSRARYAATDYDDPSGHDPQPGRDCPITFLSRILGSEDEG